MKVLLIILACILVFMLTVILVAISLSTKPYRGPKSNHFDGNTFKNYGRSAKGLKDVAQYAKKRQKDKWINNYETFSRTEELPVPSPENIQFTFINHSSFLIQHKGLNILTDPIWSKRCSPVQFAGPKRMRPPGIAFEILPKIDIVLISHNHYDHLDKNTIKRINKKHNPQYFVPLGMTQIMKKYGCKNIIELDWWQSVEVHDFKITSTPANHFSSRGIRDRNTSLWCGYIVKSDLKKIYFAGDTGYNEIFQEIGAREGPMDLSFIPIGAFKPEWFMSPIHVNPAEAVQIHKDVFSKKSIAMHFGTFPLADDNPDRAIRDLKAAREAADIEASIFQIPEEGIVYIDA